MEFDFVVVFGFDYHFDSDFVLVFDFDFGFDFDFDLDFDFDFDFVSGFEFAVDTGIDFHCVGDCVYVVVVHQKVLIGTILFKVNIGMSRFSSVI